MKRIGAFLIVATLLFFVGSGFSTVTKAPVEIFGCNLKIEEVNLVLKSLKTDGANPLNLSVNVLNNGKMAAKGFVRLDWLNMPAGVFSVDIPLTAKLQKNAIYDVCVVADTRDNFSIKGGFKNQSPRGSSSNSFFERNFQPLPELNELRNSIGAISIRKEMGIY
ncbi:MAG: hypothetical protein Kow0029_14980 [Candidatus Rifleibacteriota bacterium]